MIPVMYGESQMCAATVVLYTSILLPLRQIKQSLVAAVVTILFGYNNSDDAGPVVVIDSLVEASRISTSRSSCNYEDEDRAVSTMKRLLAATTYERSSSTSEEEEEASCSICLGEMATDGSGGGGVCKLKRCTHVFHMDCIEKWVERGHYTCPLCRTSIFCSLD